MELRDYYSYLNPKQKMGCDQTNVLAWVQGSPRPTARCPFKWAPLAIGPGPPRACTKSQKECSEKVPLFLAFFLQRAHPDCFPGCQDG